MSAEQSLTTDRFGDWVEVACRTYVDLHVTQLSDTPFRAGIDLTSLGDTVLAELHATPQRVERRPAEIARSCGEYAILILQQSGTMIVAQDGRDARLAPGAAAIVDTTRPYTLHFPEFGMRSTGQLTLEPAGNATRVTWSNEGDVGANPVNRYFALMTDRMVGPDFEGGLANLKSLAEK